MNDEIKEILDRLKDRNNYISHSMILLSIKETTLLLDYITNLQEENERLKEDITTMNDYIGKIQKENNILKENAEHNDKVVDKAKWNEMIYKSRNEKAIEYLGINEEILETCEIYDVNGIEVYKILQGGDK